MKRANYLRYTLELIVILGYLVTSVTILTYSFLAIPMDHIFIGSILLALGVIEFTDFFTWRYQTRIKSIQSLVMAVAIVAMGAIFIFVEMDIKLLCILFGALSIGSALAKIATGALNLTRQPLLNTIKIIIAIIEIVFSILLIIRTTNSLHAHMTFIGISLAVLTFTLLVEFIVHRYQRI